MIKKLFNNKFEIVKEFEMQDHGTYELADYWIEHHQGFDSIFTDKAKQCILKELEIKTQLALLQKVKQHMGKTGGTIAEFIVQAINTQLFIEESKRKGYEVTYYREPGKGDHCVIVNTDGWYYWLIENKKGLLG